MRVLRISHSAVVTAWRERERELRRLGVDVELISARVWNEGGLPVTLDQAGDDFAQSARTVGRHPNVFLFDPRPLWRAMRTNSWDVVDVHEEPCSLAAAEVIALHRLARSRTPIVLYSAQNLEKRYPPPFRWFERHALRTAAGVSVCNTEAGRILRDKGLRSAAAEIPLGVDLSLYAPARRTPPDGPMRIGYVGRLEPHKGVHVVIDALGALSDATLELVGAGPAESALRERARVAGVADRVVFRGAVDSDALAATYRSFDVLVVPSLPTPGWVEQFGRVVVEAMASGVPVLASRSGALPDVVGAAGVLVEPGDVCAWVAALAVLATSPERWTELREAGLERAQRYSWAAVAKGMHDLYIAVVAGTHPADLAHVDRPLEVVVIAYGPPDKLDRALQNLTDRYVVTVVDNSSNRATEAVVRRHGGHYHDPGRNLGFAAGVNFALSHRAVPGADVLLLNPDAEVGPDAVDRLHAHLAADARLACVGPDQVGVDGTPDRVSWPFPTPGRAWLEAVGLGRFDTGEHFVIGSVLLLRAEALADVGTFDEQFFLYSEETDWQRRALDRGWRVALVPTAQAMHEGAGTGADPTWRTAQFTASLEQYVRKHHGRLGWFVFRSAVVAGAGARTALLPGAQRRRVARTRLGIYLRGPVRVNAALRRPGS